MTVLFLAGARDVHFRHREAALAAAAIQNGKFGAARL
jgi:hypothetical protein